MNKKAAPDHAALVGEALAEAGLSLVTAESCTGGWVAKRVTDIAGSSAWFDRGFVTYSNAAKTDQLGVAADLLAQHGAVSQAVAAAMAEGALAHSHADIAVAITGVAGPGGGTEEKPVGTVWFAWARRDEPAETLLRELSGDRDNVRRFAVRVALQGVIDRVRNR